jgi:two-component sensor histidine kinase
MLAAAALGSAPVAAAGAAWPESSGFWLFASTALILVAGLAYALGRAGRREPGAATPAAPEPAAPPPSAEPPADDAVTLKAVWPLVPAGLRVFCPADEGGWVPIPFPGPEPEPSEAQPPGSWRVTAAALAPQSKADCEGWTLQRVGSGAAERLLMWPSAPLTAPDASSEAAAFSYTVSHDLRAPLRVVDGFARILKEDYGRQFDRIGNDHLDRVLAAAARMNTMIDAMLSLARLSTKPLARQPVDLSQLADFIVEDLRHHNPHRMVEASIEPGLRVVGDPTLLRLVLENLLSNAWKYTARCETGRVWLASRAHDGRRVFEVGDNGAGFDMRSADRLFGLFQRLHSQSDFPGTGVGLASVQRIVRRHGGEIWAESAPGQGARFMFTLAT